MEDGKKFGLSFENSFNVSSNVVLGEGVNTSLTSVSGIEFQKTESTILTSHVDVISCCNAWRGSQKRLSTI